MAEEILAEDLTYSLANDSIFVLPSTKTNAYGILDSLVKIMDVFAR